MKTTGIVGFILSIFALLISGFCLYSMQNSNIATSDDTEYVDSLATATVQNMINPLFSSVDEVLVYRDLSVEGNVIDLEFNDMPESILKNVAGVIIKREGHASKRSIIYEYRANKQVYDNLPATQKNETSTLETVEQKSASSMEGNSVTKVDSPAAPADETRFQQRDTTINGKTYKMRTKTEIMYE